MNIFPSAVNRGPSDIRLSALYRFASPFQPSEECRNVAKHLDNVLGRTLIELRLGCIRNLLQDVLPGILTIGNREHVNRSRLSVISDTFHELVQFHSALRVLAVRKHYN